ncbi:MAG: chemotaxis protein CheD [Nannocystaceae bacterium]|nr:chemotaxis protein CheD [bacterium]
MNPAVVNIGELAVRKGESETLRMLGIGSCVAVIVVDVNNKVGGMAHVVLPQSDPRDPVSRPPAYYADTAIPALIKALREAGSPARPGFVRVRLVGGASPAGTGFGIGERNVAAVKQVLKKHGLSVAAEHTGGTASRTVSLVLPFEQVTIASPEFGEKVL